MSCFVKYRDEEVININIQMFTEPESIWQNCLVKRKEYHFHKTTLQPPRDGASIMNAKLC